MLTEELSLKIKDTVKIGYFANIFDHFAKILHA